MKGLDGDRTQRLDPVGHGPRLKVLRTSDSLLRSGVETHIIENVGVPMFTIPQTLVACFRHRKSFGINVAVEALRESLRQRETTPAVIAECARKRGAWSVMAPYLETLPSLAEKHSNLGASVRSKLLDQSRASGQRRVDTHATD